MKILAFSDISEWKDQEKIIEQTQPDVTVLAGDLTSDGGSVVWKEALKAMPSYKAEYKVLLNKHDLPNNWRNIELSAEWWRIHNFDIFHEKLELLRTKYHRSEEFFRMKPPHVKKFYKFLKHAGKKSPVLVVKGNHDDDFDDAYNVEKIEKIKGCHELSGKSLTIRGIRFLGLGYTQSYYLRKLRPLIEEYKKKVDVTIVHCDWSRTPLLSSLEAKLMIRGHSGVGSYLVNNVPSAFIGGSVHALVELKKEKSPIIDLYRTKFDGSIEILKKQRGELFKRYEWLKPYPKNMLKEFYYKFISKIP
jgi:Icc-related predicted phosphoesterase